MFESKSGVFLIAGIGSFAVAFLSNALLPILMYRHVPEKTARETITYPVINAFADLYEHYPEQFEKHLLPAMPEAIRSAFAKLKSHDERAIFLFADLKDSTSPTLKNDAIVDLAANTLKVGRKAYVGEACWHCHSQFVRPVSNESRRWGEVAKSWEYQNELQRPVMFGTRRVGPDLSRESGRRSNDWHAVHLLRPKDTSPESVMPEYPWFFDKDANGNANSALPNHRGLAIILYMQWLGSELESQNRSGDRVRTSLGFAEGLNQ